MREHKQWLGGARPPWLPRSDGTGLKRLRLANRSLEYQQRKKWPVSSSALNVRYHAVFFRMPCSTKFIQHGEFALAQKPRFFQ